MAIRDVVLGGFGNGTFSGTIPLVVTRGYVAAAKKPSGSLFVRSCGESLLFKPEGRFAGFISDGGFVGSKSEGGFIGGVSCGSFTGFKEE